MTDLPRNVTRCDKAHHGDAAPVADVVLRCQGCGRIYARCADCERYRPGSAEASMRAHLRASYCLSRGRRERA